MHEAQGPAILAAPSSVLRRADPDRKLLPASLTLPPATSCSQQRAQEPVVTQLLSTSPQPLHSREDSGGSSRPSLPPVSSGEPGPQVVRAGWSRTGTLEPPVVVEPKPGPSAPSSGPTPEGAARRGEGGRPCPLSWTAAKHQPLDSHDAGRCGPSPDLASHQHAALHTASQAYTTDTVRGVCMCVHKDESSAQRSGNTQSLHLRKPRTPQ